MCRDLLRANLQQHGREARVVELEVPLVVKLEERRRVGVLLLEVEVVELGLLCRVAAVLAHINLCKSSICYQSANDFTTSKLLPLTSSACTHMRGTFRAP